MKRLLLKWSSVGVGAVLALLAPAKAGADFFYHFNAAFSGTPPAGAAPWITAFFQDVGANTVNMTLTTGGLSPGEFVSDLYLNVVPSLSLSNLNIALLSSAGIFTPPGTSTGEDAFQADGDGKYDINFGFATAGAGRFDSGDSATFQFTGTSLSTLSFMAQSTHAGGAGEFFAAAHIQGIAPGGTNSGWVYPSLGAEPAPEPTSLAFLALGAMVWAGLRWSRTFKPALVRLQK